ncbi:uncharacterized protein LOC132875289 isoform X2 [Neoarius graeffei]|uniref:uncharacterized protein LOC132875289 isoform X2 n=1 Tax=Neoarius graeffei TaxID=443677 RepID=UPI00298BF34C|nr:uncharacterized protein LOC132875289 isoform X2 [Neoarius graeffei]
MVKLLRWVMVEQTVLSNEAGSSTAMEKEGLTRALAQLEEEGVAVKELVTDRHVSIRKMMRDHHPTIRHSVDIWHIDKGMGKKLTALGKERGCDLVKKWKPAISKHLYWCVNKGKGDPDVSVAAWKALENHVINIHTHDDPKFDKCLHGEIEEREWFKPSTKAYTKLKEIAFSKNMMKDIRQLTPNSITSGVESFHSLLNHMAPKMLHFSYHAIRARYQIAIIHHNENSARVQAKTKGGDDRYNIVYPKFKKGSHTLCKVFEKATYGYVTRLMNAVHKHVINDNKYLEDPSKPPPLSSTAIRISKEDAVKQHKTRFMINETSVEN